MNVPGLGTRPYWRVPVPLMLKINHILSTKTHFEHILDQSKNHGKNVKKKIEKRLLRDNETKNQKSQRILKNYDGPKDYRTVFRFLFRNLLVKEKGGPHYYFVLPLYRPRSGPNPFVSREGFFLQI